MRTPRLSDERGIALAVAVFALVIIGAMVAGTFFSGRLEQRTGENTMTAAQVFNAAEGEATTVYANWNPAWNALPPATPTSAGSASLGGGLFTTSTVTRLNNELFLVRTDAEMTQGGEVTASRSVGLLGRLRSATAPVPSAITVLGNLRLQGRAEVSGNDANPGGWSGCPAGSNAPGVIYNPNTGTIRGSGQVQGNPPILQDPTLDSTGLATAFQQLSATADIVLPGGGNISGVAPSRNAANLCNTTDPQNWGEPLNQSDPCANYFPVIYVNGDLDIRNSRGQGILLVNGDLSSNGNFQFYGLVLVRGNLEADHRSTEIHGSVLAGSAELDLNTLTSSPVVQFSSCAVQRAIAATATVFPLGERSWVQMY